MSRSRIAVITIAAWPIIALYFATQAGGTRLTMSRRYRGHVREATGLEV